MTKTELENKILDLVASGIKGADLTLKLMSYDLAVTNNELLDAIFDMIQRGDLVEVEYVIRGMSKSFIVPKGTVINVIKRRY